MRKIAILVGREVTTYTYDDEWTTHNIAASITEWTDVTQEEYSLLQKAQYEKNFTIIEQMPEQEKFIKKTVAGILERIRQEEELRQKEADKRKAAAEQRKLKKLAKNEEQEKALLKSLQEKYSVKEYP